MQDLSPVRVSGLMEDGLRNDAVLCRNLHGIVLLQNSLCRRTRTLCSEFQTLVPKGHDFERTMRCLNYMA